MQHIIAAWLLNYLFGFYDGSLCEQLIIFK